MAQQSRLAALHCTSELCSVATTTAVLPANAGVVAATIGTDGNPVLVFSSQGLLRVIHCTDPFCVPHRRSY